MSDHTTARALKRHGIRFRLMVILLLVISLFGLRTWWLLSMAERSRIRIELTRLDQRLFEEFLRYRYEKGVRLAFFPPPIKKEEATTWARQIENQFNHSVDVFWICDSVLTWTRTPESSDVVKWTEEQVKLQLISANGAFNDEGNARFRFKMHRTTGGTFVLWITQRLPDGQLWGVIFPDHQNWDAFFRNLFSSQNDGESQYSPYWMLRTCFALPRSGVRGEGAGMKVQLSDGTILTTVDLDETTDSLQYGDQYRPSVKYFAGPDSPSYIHARFIRRNGWFLVIVPLLLIIPLYIDDRAFRLLTEH